MAPGLKGTRQTLSLMKISRTCMVNTRSRRGSAWLVMLGAYRAPTRPFPGSRLADDGRVIKDGQDSPSLKATLLPTSFWEWQTAHPLLLQDMTSNFRTG